MITILKDGVPIRHVVCPKEMYAIQCLEGETYVEETLPIPTDLRYKEFPEYKIMEINNWYSASVAAITLNVSRDEVSTWAKQENEARAWLLDNSVHTPFIDSLLISREDHTKISLVNKILEKASSYACEVGRLLGEKQKREKLILGN